MNKRTLTAIGLSLILPLVMITTVLAIANSAEIEPNNSPGTANPIYSRETMNAAIDPTGDVDYFLLEGINTTWGFIALLDTTSSTNSTDGSLAVLGANGTTVWQSDSGSWEHGAGIALQNYADGSATHYLRVNEQGNDNTISSYTLRYYDTVVAAQPEVEPNATRVTGTPSSFTQSGAIDPSDDVDCFAFHGRADDTILLALNGDPEGDGSPIDLILELIGPSDTVLKQANQSGIGGSEFIEYIGLPGDGVYAYCVRLGTGVGGPTATFKAGLVRNGGLYYPSYSVGPAWLNPIPGNYARIGDVLSFRLAITNTSPLAIPGDIRITTEYSDVCLELVSAIPSPTATSPGYVSWDGQKSGMAPGEIYSVTLNVRALTWCSDTIYQATSVAYYFTGHVSTVGYKVMSPLHLPLVQSSP